MSGRRRNGRGSHPWQMQTSTPGEGTIVNNNNNNNNNVRGRSTAMSVGEDGVLDDRDAAATATTDPDAEVLAGDVVAHKLENAYPGRPTPIKVQSGDNVPEDGEVQEGNDDDDHQGVSDSQESKGDKKGGSDNDDGGVNPDDLGVLEVANLPGLPLGMLGPVIGGSEAVSSSDEDSGLMEIEIMPAAMSMDMSFGGGPAADKNDGIVEEIWITSSDEPPSGMDAGGFNPLDSLASEIEQVMGGLMGGLSKPKDPAVTLGQPIDEVMLPNGQRQPQPIVDSAPTAVSTPPPQPVPENGWDTLGKVAGVALSVLGPVVVITLLGFLIFMCVRKMRFKNKGYREVQSRLCGDEEWN
ncbi:hypothetical protein AA313_de0205405 [Arthrobotrys entomopaga]|nr:hypothetical protein AA313_de0205405 [Arthrobotrys entomopaga]